MAWVDAKEDTSCSSCGEEINEGARMVVDEHTGDKFCDECGVEIDGEDPEALLV